MSIKVVSPRGTDYGAIQVYLQDDEEGLQLGSSLRIPAMQGLDFELDSDEGELFGDEEKKDVYARYLGVMATCKHGQIALDTLAVMIGSDLKEYGVSPNQTLKVHIAPKNSPYIRLRQHSIYAGESGSSLTQTFTKVRVTSLTIKNAAKGYAEIEFTVKGKTAVYSHPIPSFLELEARENGIVLGDSRVYPPVRQILPLWSPDASQGFGLRTADGDYANQRAYGSATSGDYLEFVRSLGSGPNVLTVLAQVAPGRGSLLVKIDGQTVGGLDLDSPEAYNVPLRVALTVTSTGPHTIRLEMVDSSTVEISSAEIVHQGSAPVSILNGLPSPAQFVEQIPAYQYSAASTPPSVINPATNAGEKVLVEGLGEWLEYETILEAGTHSLKAIAGKGEDYGVLTAAVSGGFVGQVDLYNGSTQTPSHVDIPGTFSLVSRSPVKIRLAVNSRSGSSTGYKALLASLMIVRTATSQELLSEEHGPVSVELIPDHADDSTGWASGAAVCLRNWQAVSDGVAARSLVWSKNHLTKGAWRARLIGEQKPGGAELELLHASEVVAKFNTSGVSDQNGRFEAVFQLPVSKFGPTILRNPTTTEARVQYLRLEKLYRSESLGAVYVNDAAEHHFPSHLNGTTWPGITFSVNVNGAPADFSSATAELRVRSGSLSGPTVMSLTDSSGLVLSGNTIQATAMIPELPPGLYWYDLRITDGSNVRTYVYGTWTIL